MTAALTALRTAETAAAKALATPAAASFGFAALLYASLAAATTGYATALGADDPPAPAALPTERRELAPWTESEALQNALAAAHAMLYGYKAAIGSVSESSALGKDLLARLAHLQQLRDRLVELVVAAGQQPVAAEPAYRLPFRVTDRTTATRLVRRLEVAVQPHLGRWVAGAGVPAVSALARAELDLACATALERGAGVAAWPGWPA